MHFEQTGTDKEIDTFGAVAATFGPNRANISKIGRGRVEIA